MNKTWLCIALLAVVLQQGESYSNFRDMIPNGNNVTHPCDPSQKWNGVGHQKSGGGGVRNPFGQAFDNNGKTWSQTLCMADSDGDGKTNGEELGDPNCTWSIGQAPKISPAPSHPGICEPIDSAECRAKNSFLDCGNTGFNCPSTKQPDVFEHRVGFSPNTPVPDKETTYMCQGFSFPSDKDYHLIANKPAIDNINVAHHIIVYGCAEGVTLSNDTINEPYGCFMGNNEGCQEIIAIWTVGIEGMCNHEDAGFRVGMTGYKYGIFEIHWNNPEYRSDYTDGSGVTLFLTPTLRPNDAGVFNIGQNILLIPPMEQRYTAHGHCSGKCTSQIFTGPLNVFGVINHMHGLGAAALSTVSKSESEIHELARDDVYDYNSPVYYELPEMIQVNPGDTLNLTCHFNSMTRQKSTYSGIGTNDEMCYAFLFYYPKSNSKVEGCTASYEYDRCELEQDMIGECRKESRDYTSPEVLDLAGRIMANCIPGVCLKECIPHSREFLSNPCNQGSFRYQNYIYGVEKNPDPASKAGAVDYFARAESCAMKIAELDGKCDTEKGTGSWQVGTAPLGSNVSLWVLSVFVFVALLW